MSRPCPKHRSIHKRADARTLDGDGVVGGESRLSNSNRGCGFRWALLFVFAILLCAGCDDRVAGAVGTGNAGRVMGKVGPESLVKDGGYAVRLVALDDEGSVIDSTECDSTGLFRFSEHKAGPYRVEVWRNGRFRGETSFVIDGDVDGIVVVLVEGVFQQELDLSPIGLVDSVFVDYRENRGVKVGDKWLVQTTRDTAFVIHAHLGGATGRWEEWVVVRRSGRDVLFNLADSRTLDFQRRIDSGAYLLTPHTMALWDFDSSLPGGILEDRSPNGNDLTFQGGASFVSSPHGRAFIQSSGVPLVVGPEGDTLPNSLRWDRTGMMTYEMRFKMDSIPKGGMVLLGSETSVRIWVMPSRQLVVESQIYDEVGEYLRWGSVATLGETVPVGEWIDLAVSLDWEADQIYVWIDEHAVPTYTRSDWGRGSWMVNDSAGAFCVGGASWDRRPSHFQLDEVRISDTLIFGKGLPIEFSEVELVSSLSLSEGVAIFAGAGVDQVCSDCSSVLLGFDATTQHVGAYAWKPQIPASVLGKKIVSAALVVFDTAVSVVDATTDYRLFRIEEDWSREDEATGWILGREWTRRVSANPVAMSPRNAGSSGGLVFEITNLVQNWVDDSNRNHGVLLRAVDENAPGVGFFAAGTPDDRGRKMQIEVRYR